MAGKRDEVTIAEVAEALNISKTTVSAQYPAKGRVNGLPRARVFDYIGKGPPGCRCAAALRWGAQPTTLALVIPSFYTAGLAVPAQVHGRRVEHGGPAPV